MHVEKGDALITPCGSRVTFERGDLSLIEICAAIEAQSFCSARAEDGRIVMQMLESPAAAPERKKRRGVKAKKRRRRR